MTWFALRGDERITRRCATEGCGGQPTFRLEAGGIGSDYCSGCKAKIAGDETRNAHLHVLEEIVAERQRQIAVEGWTPEHDDIHTGGEMAQAASCYAKPWPGIRVETLPAPPDWPWGGKWWKPRDRRRNLVRAAALIVAEIERLDRNQKPTAAAIKAAEPMRARSRR